VFTDNVTKSGVMLKYAGNVGKDRQGGNRFQSCVTANRSSNVGMSS